MIARLAVGILLLTTSSASAQLAPDDVAGARRLLQERGRAAETPMVALMRQHRYPEAEELLNRRLREAPGDEALLALRVKLLIQAWRLDQAMRVAETLKHGKVLVGRIQLLEKKYDAALASARAASAANPRDAEAHLLEADVHFWREKPELAEAPLKRALELDPLNADARFAYGYAIWRRVDARQLPAMAAQWNLALEIDSLHYVTHWHFGNGHTHLTYADYAQPTDDTVRTRLRAVDDLIGQHRMNEALRATRQIESEFPQSLLPTLTRGSIFYMANEPSRAARLDSAQAAFLSLLRRQPNYGPAHNALAAVLKQRQFTYHAQYDSLEAEIARQPVPTDSAFYQEFRNIRYYPGERVIKMAVQQLGPALAYIPFIARLRYSYVIPPLHHDLTHAMTSPFFRTSTTFDNRQWMDIRGSGGNNASAGIEYVERGSHQERVVLLHEYVHQFHGAVLTDAQSRRIRQLYHAAVAANRTLDYYAANNESEFFAQAYEAYLTPVKVHPLNHKAMNTRADLIAKDPELFAFLDTLITENRAYLAGDRNAMRKNWEQVYITLARQARQSARGDTARLRQAHVLLDSALFFQKDNPSALLERSALFQAQGKWPDAELALQAATTNGPAYAPVYEARADFLRERARANKRNSDVAERIALYRRALELETDLSERADLNRALRELYHNQAMYQEAIELAKEYAANAPTSSTYLRDRKDEAAAFAAELRSSIGYLEVDFFQELLARKPQNFTHRGQAIWANWESENEMTARALLEDAVRLLRATRQTPPVFQVLRAMLLQPDSGVERFTRDAIANGGSSLAHNERVRLAMHLMHAGRVADALKLIPADTAGLPPRQQADFLYLRSLADDLGGRAASSLELSRRALRHNPYHIDARNMAVRHLLNAGKVKEARKIGVDDVAQLELGGLYHREIRNMLAEH
jgi:tetratricopeptide (TPR) repeat protein